MELGESHGDEGMGMTMRMSTASFFYAIYFLRYYLIVTCYLSKIFEPSILNGEKEAMKTAELRVEFAWSPGACQSY